VALSFLLALPAVMAVSAGRWGAARRLGGWPVVSVRAAARPGGSRGLLGLPVAAQGPISSALGRGTGGYLIRGLRAINGAQRLEAEFAGRGVRIFSGRMRFSVTLSSYGDSAGLQRVSTVGQRVVANRVFYAHGPVSEWWANGPLGLEQGFTVSSRPRAGSRRLTLSLSLTGNVRARLQGGSVLLRGGGDSLRYGGLVASDARGRALSARFALRQGGILIEVDDRGARYPVRVDPFVEQQKIVPGDESGSQSDPGFSVAASSDGSTVLIGAPFDYPTAADTGAVWVFARSGSTWKEQAKIFPTDAGKYGFAEFGSSVAVSADGNTAVIGGPYDNTLGATGTGAMWVYVRSGTTWTEQQKIVPTDAEPSGSTPVGAQVALSADGDTALTASDNGPGNTAAWVYTRSGSTWTEQQEIDPPTTDNSYSVALSGDGDTAMIGGGNPACAGATSCWGAVWVYTRSGSSWTEQQKIAPTDAIPPPPPSPPASCPCGYPWGSFPFGVSLSSSGDTAVIGGPSDSNHVGAAWIYARSGGTWSEQQKIAPSDEGSSSSGFGASVSISSDGNTVLIGGPGPLVATKGGAAWIYSRSGGAWSEQKISPADAGATTQIGKSVALSSDAATAVIGGPDDENGNAAVWIYTSRQLVVNSTGNEDDTATDLSNGVCNVNLTGPAACTLRAAIEVANKLGGATITFDIPATLNGIANTFDGQVPDIRVPAADASTQLPAISAPAVIDGNSQPGSHEVELKDSITQDQGAGDCSSPPFGLMVGSGGAGSAVRGLDIHAFATQIGLEGSSTVQDDLIGTDPTGKLSEPGQAFDAQAGILLASEHNLIGGPGHGNVISGLRDLAVVGVVCAGIATPDRRDGGASDGANTIQGNTIGPARGGQRELLIPDSAVRRNQDFPNETAESETLSTELELIGRGDTIGGAQPGEGNLIVGPNGGGSVLSDGAAVQGNTMVGNIEMLGAGVFGGSTRTPGTDAGNNLDGDMEGGGGLVVQGNHIHGGRWGVILAGGNNTVGGRNPNEGNLIESTRAGVPLGPEPQGDTGGVAVGNYIFAGQVVQSSSNTIEHNVIRDNGGDGGVVVFGGTGNLILANEMSGNTLGINLGGGPFLYSNFLHPGPNDYQPYPVLFSVSSAGGLQVKGRQPGLGGASYRVELYSQRSCTQDSVTPGQGLHYLGSNVVAPGPFGNFTMSFPHAAAGDQAVTATTTGSSGDTSEFSPCLTIGHSAASFTKSGVTTPGNTITITTTTGPARDPGVARAAATRPLTAHGYLQIVCPPITTGSCVGTVRLATTGGHAVTLVLAHFKLKAGQGKTFRFKLPAALFQRVKRAHRVAAKATISAHDGAKPAHHKNTTRKLTLVYS